VPALARQIRHLGAGLPAAKYQKIHCGSKTIPAENAENNRRVAENCYASLVKDPVRLTPTGIA
jgi:hypothetical protein